MAPGDPVQRRWYKANFKKHSKSAKGKDIKYIYYYI